jgi:hypothetical protein
MGTKVIDYNYDNYDYDSEQNSNDEGAVHVLLSRSYPDFIQILSGFLKKI